MLIDEDTIRETLLSYFSVSNGKYMTSISGTVEKLVLEMRESEEQKQIDFENIISDEI